jgi:hypothetical protein
MAVLIEGFSVVVRREAIEGKFPGGLDAYIRQRVNETYCADDRVCRVAFTVGADARAYVRQLVAAGLDGPVEGPSPDFAIVTPVSGHLIPCERATSFAVPGNWRPDTTKVISEAELAANYEAVKVDHLDGGGIVETFRHRQTGETIFRGRPDVARVQQRYNELLENYGEIERMRARHQRSATEAFLKRATLQGMAARLLSRWDLAEQAFRRVTVLRPTFVSAWNDLTWALSSLGRLEEAETTARHAVDLSPDDHASVANLASVLGERGKLDEALTTIKHALKLRPGDKINEEIYDQIRKEQGFPWYKRLFVN